MNYYVDVTLTFTECVEADSAEEAEELVRQMDWSEIPKNIDIDVSEE